MCGHSSQRTAVFVLIVRDVRGELSPHRRPPLLRPGPVLDGQGRPPLRPAALSVELGEPACVVDGRPTTGSDAPAPVGAS